MKKNLFSRIPQNSILRAIPIAETIPNYSTETTTVTIANCIEAVLE
jgi:hypothetical protein